jgi:hypothetical protein
MRQRSGQRGWGNPSRETEMRCCRRAVRPWPPALPTQAGIVFVEAEVKSTPYAYRGRRRCRMAACTEAFEWRAIGSGQWHSTDRMPIGPVLGVGLWPLLQLALLVPSALVLARCSAVRR